MNTSMTIGQYYPENSIVHKLDPRLKLAATFVFITMLFVVNSIFGYLIAVFYLACILRLSKIPIKLIFKSLKAIYIILGFTFVLNIFFYSGENIIWEFGFLKIYREGLILAFKMAMRLILLIMSSSFLTLTTSPVQLTGAIEYFLNPFKKIGLPAAEIAMMMTITLRFIPTILEELDKIVKAQTSRGADFETGGLIKKAKNMLPIMVPLFISSFRRAEELALAMEARCYSGDDKRTKMKQMKFLKNDFYALAVIILFVVAIIISRFVNY